MKKFVDAQTHQSSVRVKERLDKGLLAREACSSAVLQGVEHVEKAAFRTQAFKDKQMTLYNTIKVRRPNHLGCLFGGGGFSGSWWSDVSAMLILTTFASCPQDYPFKLRQNMKSDAAVSVMRVPGRVDRHIGTTTSCNKGIGMILRAPFKLATGLVGKDTDYGCVTSPRFAILNDRAISKAPKKWTREVSSTRAKRIVSKYAKHLTGATTGAAHDDTARCLENGLAIELYKTNREARVSLGNDTCHQHYSFPHVHVFCVSFRPRR
jgi:hypothetical protein